MSESPRLPTPLRNAESPGEGAVFVIPLPNHEYVLGVVIARYPRVVRVGMLCHPITELPGSNVSVSSADVKLVTQVGATALDDGRWPVVGAIQNFAATEWPNPPILPGERVDRAQAPADLEREMIRVVEGARRLRVVGDQELIPVEHDEGRRYADLVLGSGPLLARIAKDVVDFDAGSFAATVAFIEYEGEWHTGEFNRDEIPTTGGWVPAGNHERALVPALHRFLTEPGRSAVFDYSWLDLQRDASIWQRIASERFGPLEIFPLQIVFRDEGFKREMYACVGGGSIDEATTEAILRTTFDPVIGIVFMLDIEIDKLPSHACAIDEEGLAELAQHVQGLALRYTSYDGYLIWRSRDFGL